MPRIDEIQKRDEEHRLRIYEELRKTYSLMKRLGENVSGPMNMVAYFSNFEMPILITEGLIKSYDIDRVINFLSSAFGFKNLVTNEVTFYDIRGEESPNTINKETKENGTESIVIRLNDRFDIRPEVEQYLKKYGWILAREDTYSDGKYFTYEKKFNEYFYNIQLKRVKDCLYHVTDTSKLDIIKKRGLRAFEQTNPNGYMHDERVYLFYNKPDTNRIKITARESPVILKIDLNKLPDTIKFYFDPRVDMAFYTFENIPPDAINVEE